MVRRSRRRFSRCVWLSILTALIASVIFSPDNDQKVRVQVTVVETAAEFSDHRHHMRQQPKLERTEARSARAFYDSSIPPCSRPYVRVDYTTHPALGRGPNGQRTG